MTMADRLQALLDTACAADALERDRLPLEDFLAGLQQEALNFDETLLNLTQLAICKSLLEFLNNGSNAQDALTTSKATQTIAATDSHAVQTDAATISLWGMLPKARDEAYSRGVSDGKEQGHMQGIDHGKEIGMNEGLAVGFSQGHAEGLSKGLAQREDAEITRSLGMNKKAEYSSEITEGLKQEREDFQRLGHSFSNKVLQGGPIHENNDLSLTQELPESGDRKENTKATVLSNDPFASIWQEVRGKKAK